MHVTFTSPPPAYPHQGQPGATSPSRVPPSRDEPHTSPRATSPTSAAGSAPRPRRRAADRSGSPAPRPRLVRGRGRLQNASAGREQHGPGQARGRSLATFPTTTATLPRRTTPATRARSAQQHLLGSAVTEENAGTPTATSSPNAGARRHRRQRRRREPVRPPHRRDVVLGDGDGHRGRSRATLWLGRLQPERGVRRRRARVPGRLLGHLVLHADVDRAERADRRDDLCRFRVGYNTPRPRARPARRTPARSRTTASRSPLPSRRRRRRLDDHPAERHGDRQRPRQRHGGPLTTSSLLGAPPRPRPTPDLRATVTIPVRGPDGRPGRR